MLTILFDIFTEQTITDEQVNLLAEKMSTIKIIPDKKQNKTLVAKITEDESPHDGAKCKRKGRKKCNHGKDKKPSKIEQRTVVIVATTKSPNAAVVASLTRVTYIALLIACKLLFSWAVPV